VFLVKELHNDIIYLNFLNMSIKEKVKQQIDEIDDQIDLWESRIESVKADAKVEYKKKLSDLKTKRNEIRRKYDELTDAAEERWDESKEVFTSASDSFREGFSKLKSLFE